MNVRTLWPKANKAIFNLKKYLKKPSTTLSYTNQSPEKSNLPSMKIKTKDKSKIIKETNPKMILIIIFLFIDVPHID